MRRAILLAALLFSAVCGAQQIEGTVVGVTDGDTVTLLTAERRQIKIRLAEIDTPESAQPYGSKAKQVLSGLAFQRRASVQVQGVDKYGRTIGRVTGDGVNVNAEMVSRGAAWVYRQYSKDPALLYLEAQAKAAKRGLWGLPEAERVPPWEWRHGGTVAAPPKSVVEPPAQAGGAPAALGVCGGKSKCGEMASCAEARHYLNDCGLRKLDRDGDGIPCESLCN